jgi:hypothetical protein
LAMMEEEMRQTKGIIIMGLYLYIIKNALSALKCTRHSSGKSTLDADTDIECWTGEHIGLAVVGMAFFVFYALLVPWILLGPIRRQAEKTYTKGYEDWVWLSCAQKVIECLMSIVDKRYWPISWFVVFVLNTVILWLAIIFMYPKIRKWQKKNVMKPLKRLVKWAHSQCEVLSKRDPYVDAKEEYMVKGTHVHAMRRYQEEDETYFDATVVFASKKKTAHWALRFADDNKVVVLPLKLIKIHHEEASAMIKAVKASQAETQDWSDSDSDSDNEDDMHVKKRLEHQATDVVNIPYEDSLLNVLNLMCLASCQFVIIISLMVALEALSIPATEL